MNSGPGGGGGLFCIAADCVGEKVTMDDLGSPAKLTWRSLGGMFVGGVSACVDGDDSAVILAASATGDGDVLPIDARTDSPPL
jgi:hypothetical protein